MELYTINIGHGHIVLEGVDSFELTYSKDGKVEQTGGCIALAEDFDPERDKFQETWLSKKIMSED